MQQINETKQRVREGNWTIGEKACLRECIASHIRIIEDKSNDGAMIAKKRDAWNQVKMTMLAAGYERKVTKLRQQWARMKMAAKKSFGAERRAERATGNIIEVPNVDCEDLLIQSMIAPELEEDTILIDSDTYVVAELHDDDSVDALEEIPSCKVDFEATRPKSVAQVGRSTELDPATQPKPRTHVDRLRQIPPYKRNVVEERQRQIQNEASNSDALHLLQENLLRAQIQYQRTLEENEQELHALRVQLLRQQINGQHKGAR
ncbi:uncharacterized protein [Eurosta solidaginis]|uniref:uncharacterized protein n=1 Tax=Eurosta solidaginis TaxID=178769 RepID=UPI003530B9D8